MAVFRKLWTSNDILASMQLKALMFDWICQQYNIQIYCDITNSETPFMYSFDNFETVYLFRTDDEALKHALENHPSYKRDASPAPDRDIYDPT